VEGGGGCYPADHDGKIEVVQPALSNSNFVIQYTIWSPHCR